MNHLNTSLLSAQQLEQLHKWIAETGELYVDVYLPHSGGSGTAYFLLSLDQLEQLISDQTWKEVAVTVFRRLQYPLRGVADELLLGRALEMIPNGEWYTIVLLEDYFYPHEPSWSNGNNHAEFRQDFSEVMGHQVGIGQNPLDKYPNWIYSGPEETMVLYFKRRGCQYEPEPIPPKASTNHSLD